MKKIITTALMLFISVISFAQVRTTPITTNPVLVKCNCADLKINAYFYKDGSSPNYIIRLDYFNNKSTGCVPVLTALNFTRGGSNYITVPLSALQVLSSNRGVLMYRVTPSQMRAALVLNDNYIIRYTLSYGSVALKTCPSAFKEVKLESGEPIL